MALSEKAQTALLSVVRKFQDGDLSPILAVALLQPDPNDDRPMVKWSLSNRVLAFAQTGSFDCRGFKQWEASNRHVKKGARAAFILGPYMVDHPDDPDRKIVAGYFSIAVFSDLDTEGDGPLPNSPYTPVTLPPLADVATKLGVTVSYLPTSEPYRGAYYPDHKAIRLHTHDPKTYYHELAHAVHHRLDPDIKPGQDPRQETIAEFTACVLMALYGQDYSGNAWQYIQSYATEPLTAVYKAIATVEQILDVILS